MDAVPRLPRTGKAVACESNHWPDRHPPLSVLLQTPASNLKGLGVLAGSN